MLEDWQEGDGEGTGKPAQPPGMGSHVPVRQQQTLQRGILLSTFPQPDLLFSSLWVDLSTISPPVP